MSLSSLSECLIIINKKLKIQIYVDIQINKFIIRNENLVNNIIHFQLIECIQVRF